MRTSAVILGVTICLCAVWSRWAPAQPGPDCVYAAGPCDDVECYTMPMGTGSATGSCLPQQIYFTGWDCMSEWGLRDAGAGTTYRLRASRLQCNVNFIDKYTFSCGDMRIQTLRGGACWLLWKGCGGDMVENCAG